MIARDVRITMSWTEVTYAQVVERDLAAERAEQLSAQEHVASCENKRASQAVAGFQRTGISGDQKRETSDLFGPGWNGNSTRSSGQRHSRSDHWGDYPFCERCKRYHLGACRPKARLGCGSTSHLIRDWLQLTRRNKKMADMVATARMVALTGMETKDNKTLSSGKLVLGNFCTQCC